MQRDERMIARLWRFVVERQEVRYRRHVLHRKPPWTDDPVLQAHHFTNIYREDDPGTQYVVDNMLRAERPFSTCLWNVLWYRMFGKEATWDRWAAMYPHHPFEPTRESLLRMEQVMRTMVEEGAGPFTSAYLVSNYGRSEDKVTVMLDVMEGARVNWPSTVMNGINEACAMGEQGRQQAHAVLQSIHGIGKFVAFQTLVDMCYPVLPDGVRRLPFSNDGWATCGPGAERGLGHVLPGIKPQQWNQGLAYLVERAQDELAMRAFYFRIGDDGAEQHVDRANMCNCLCEFDKYVRLSAGEGKGRRRPFSPLDSYRRDREARGHGHQIDIEEVLA
jgi:hypothetical protein